MLRTDWAKCASWTAQAAAGAFRPWSQRTGSPFPCSTTCSRLPSGAVTHTAGVLSAWRGEGNRARRACPARPWRSHVLAAVDVQLGAGDPVALGAEEAHQPGDLVRLAESSERNAALHRFLRGLRHRS